MCRHARVGFVVLVTLFSIGPASADEQSGTGTFTLQHMEVRDAATVLRTIAGIRELAVLGDDTIEIAGPRGALRLATELMQALDAAEIDPTRTFTTGDDTVVAVIPLHDRSLADVMSELRGLLIQRAAAASESGVVVVRDTPKKVASALEALGDT